MSKVGLYAGSFDPITYGHIDIIKRAEKLFDKLIVLVSVSGKKTPLFTLEERKEMIEEICSPLKNTEVDISDSFTSIYAEKKQIKTLVRGLRNASDLEYETSLSLMNQSLNPELETIFFIPKPEFSFVSSQIVREIAKINPEKLKSFIPPHVIKKLKEKGVL